MNKEEIIKLVDRYFEEKQTLDDYKKHTDKMNKDIKDWMKMNELDEIVTDKVKAKVTTSNRESFNEDALLEKLKALGAMKAVKTKEYVDMDELENLIYNGELNASELSSCREIKQVVTLKVTEKKG